MSVFRRIPGTIRKTTSSAMHLNSKSNAGASMGLNFSFTPNDESPSIENDYVVGDLIGQGSSRVYGKQRVVIVVRSLQ